jgi:DNA-binding YbaB/EbfC family protein
MKVRVPKDFGGPSQQQLMQQFNKMQEDVAVKTEEIENMEFSASSGGGAITALVSGKKEVKKIDISKDVVDIDDLEMLSDMICAAVNEAISKADTTMNDEINKITGSMNMPKIPGLF